MNNKIIVFIIFILVLIIIASGFFLLNRKNETATGYKIGVLIGIDNLSPVIDGFKNRMTEMGYVEGKGISYDVQRGNNNLEMMKTIIQKFVDDEVDLILTSGFSEDIEKVVNNPSIPVVFTVGELKSLNLNNGPNPGKNITGVYLSLNEIALGRLEMMNKLAPKAKRIWMPYSKKITNMSYDGKSIVEFLQPTAKSLGITLIEAPVADLNAVKDDLADLENKSDIGIDAILVIPGPFTIDTDVFAVMSEFASKHKIPIGGSPIQKNEESLFGYSGAFNETGKQAANFASQILKGGFAGDISTISAPIYFQINYKVAKQLGLEVPDNLMIQADEIIR